MTTSDMPVDPRLARFGADLADLWDEFCNRPEYDSLFKLYPGLGMTVHSEDGLLLKFYEEGVAFYPNND